MDLVKYEKFKFQEIVSNYELFASKYWYSKMSFIPISGIHGDNVVSSSERYELVPRTITSQIIRGYRTRRPNFIFPAIQNACPVGK